MTGKKAAAFCTYALNPGKSLRKMTSVLELLCAWGPTATMVVSLHQPELARRHCTRAVGLREGEISFDLPAGDVTDELLASLYAEP